MSKKYDKENAELKITVKTKKEQWSKALNKALVKLNKDLKIKGMRKGKAPLAQAKKHIPAGKLWEEAIAILLPELSELASKQLKDEVILDAPLYAVQKVSDTEAEIDFIYPVFPEFKLKDIEKLGIDFKIPEITSKMIDETIEKEIKKNALLSEVHETIEKDDEVIFDFIGSIDGNEFEGGKAEGHSLKIGSNSFIPDFEDAMIGKKLGKTSIDVFFPKDYHAEALKGKKAVFKLNIKSIKTREIPKLNDELAKAIMVAKPEIKTVSAMKEYYKGLLRQEQEVKSKNEFKNRVFDKLIKENTIPLPRITVMKEVKKQMTEFEDNLKKSKFSKKQYLQMVGQTEEQFSEQIHSKTEYELKTSVLFAHIAKINKIELTDENYKAEYAKYAKLYGMEPKALEGIITKEQIQIPATNDRVIDLLISYSAKDSAKKTVTNKPTKK